MENDPLREYYDAMQPSEDCIRRLRELEAAPAPSGRKRYALPIAAAAMLTLILVAGLRPSPADVTAPPAETETPAPVETAAPATASPAPALETPAPKETASPTPAAVVGPATAAPPPVQKAPAPTASPSAAPTQEPDAEVPPAQTPESLQTTAPNIAVPPEELSPPGNSGTPALPEGEYLFENERHLVHLWIADTAETTVDLTDLLVDGCYDGEVLLDGEPVRITLTIAGDGSAALIIGSAEN